MIVLKEKLDLTGYTLILPSVAVGNAAQLCVDLLISSLKSRRIGHVLSPSFIPIVGANPYDSKDSKDLCTSIDVYVIEDQKIVVLQIRSPAIQQPHEFFADLQKFVCGNNIAKTIILTSSYAYETRDQQLKSIPLRYVSKNDFLSKHVQSLDNLNWIPLESSSMEDTNISGGGFATSLYKHFSTQNMDCIILLRFCSEGDNIPEALDLLQYLNQWLRVLPYDEDNRTIKVVHPISWKHLYGNSAPLEMY